MLVDALAHDMEIRQSLSVVLDEADREIDRLSTEHYEVAVAPDGRGVGRGLTG